jgi:hypothetical protein
MKSITFVLVTVILIVTFVSCEKNTTGGRATIIAIPTFSGTSVFGATAYVYFGSTDEPLYSGSDYDLKVAGSGIAESIRIENMRPGEYYIYAVGFDSLTNKTLAGGLGVEIKWADRKKEERIVIPMAQIN